ncbi:MAG: hypothetical protein HGA16_02880 [Candidatus Moranbacteria bacterium]|nr:hypothetical protein [Candidatus Moranbacteria bacterium]
MGREIFDDSGEKPKNGKGEEKAPSLGQRGSRPIEEEWSAKHSQRRDEISGEIARLDSEIQKLARQRMEAVDADMPDFDDEVKRIGERISDLRIELEEIKYEEEKKILGRQ